MPDALVAIHLDTLNLSIYKDAMNAWGRDKVDYDVLGSSSYAFWAGKNMLGNVRKAGNYVASRGKLFAVLETSWLNSQKDADGTVNMVNNTKDAVYKSWSSRDRQICCQIYMMQFYQMIMDWVLLLGRGMDTCQSWLGELEI
ncbi:MAG: glycosyl hydrolase 53 family protein [Anaerobutyricum hallii]